MEKYFFLYLMYFFIYAFIGWVIEVSFHAVTVGKFINRGFLSGPYCPIYGFGAISVIYFLTDIAGKNKFVLFLGICGRLSFGEDIPRKMVGLH